MENRAVASVEGMRDEGRRDEEKAFLFSYSSLLPCGPHPFIITY
jgi:hypothetical protein